MTDVVEVSGLTRAFGARRAVSELSFSIRAGEVYGFLGPNGAGKTTTIRLLLGLIRPTAGTVAVFGLDPVRDAARVHARCGYLAGDLVLYPRLTGRQHLDRFAHARQLTDVGYRQDLVRRLDVELDRPVRTLSKGNRQKIGPVLAFMHRPDLLVLDEPTTGLDPLLQAEFAALVRETVADGRTIFLSSHELDEVQRLADHVTIIRGGQIVVSDTVAGLRTAAPRTVTFRFPAEVDAGRFSGLPGVHVVQVRDTLVSLSVPGALTDALRVAADLGAVDVEARAADLDDLFLTYYRTDKEQESTGAR